LNLKKKQVEDKFAQLDVNPRVRDFMEDFDNNLLDSFVGLKTSRVKRFQANYLPEGGCDSDEEEDLSQSMFIDDIQLLR
jgi:hypothetical protein